jgi:hypothetical protein
MILRYLAEGEALDLGWKKTGSRILDEMVKYNPALPCRGRSPGSGMEKTGSGIREEIVKYDPAYPCRGRSPGSGVEKTEKNRIQDPGSAGRNCEV